jgi:hypothetical protein
VLFPILGDAGLLVQIILHRFVFSQFDARLKVPATDVKCPLIQLTVRKFHALVGLRKQGEIKPVGLSDSRQKCPVYGTRMENARVLSGEH